MTPGRCCSKKIKVYTASVALLQGNLLWKDTFVSRPLQDCKRYPRIEASISEESITRLVNLEIMGDCRDNVVRRVNADAGETGN